MTIIMDSNERGLIEHAGEEFDRKNIELDFTNEVRSFYVERKTSNDFVMSIKNKHLQKQLSKLRETGYDGIIIVIIEGYYDDIRKRYKSLRGYLDFYRITLSNIYGAGIIETSDPFHTVEWIKLIDKYSRTYQNNRDKKHFHFEKVSKKEKDRRLINIMTVPGIGSKMSKKLLNKFGSIRNIIDADKEELMSVNRFGKKKYDRIVRMYESEKPYNK